MKLLRSTWHVSLWCTRKGCLLLLWSLWLVMIATAGIQYYVIRAHEISLPGPLRRLIEHRLAEQGIQFTFARGTLDFSGRILLQDVTLGPVSTPTPLVTARTVYVKLDPWELAIRRFDVEILSASGMDLHLPAMLSPSGQDETLISDVDFTLQPHGPSLAINHLTGRIAGLSVRASGILQLPPAKASKPASSLINQLVASYLRTGREAPALIARLAALESPTLDLNFTPADNRIALVRATLRAESLNLASFPRLKGAVTGALTLNAEIPLGGETAALLRTNGLLASVNVPAQGSAQDLRFNLLGLLPPDHASFALTWLDLQVGSVNWRDLAAGPASLGLTPGQDGWLTVDLSTLLAGSPWQIGAVLDPQQGRGSVQLDGRIDRALLGLVGGLVKHDLTTLLQPATPAPLHASATFLPGWKLEQAQGRLHSGPVLVGGVPLDETGTEFSYRDGRALCDQLVLRQGASLAHGLYEMDTRTMDFRFLLNGGLRPDGISPWFHDWWTHFWRDFDFSKGLPQADVDVSGRWGSLTATRVFVQAEGGATGLRGAAFDQVSTRLFVRPQWNDILHFKVAQGSHEASGSFSRFTSLEKEPWSRMTFAVDSGLSLDTMKQLFGADAASLLAPYKFAQAPRLTLAGHVESPGSPEGAHQHIDIALQSTGAVAFHDFPLSDLVFTARLRDAELTLPSLALVFAGGRATGAAKVWGDDKTRRLSFDFTLTDARLGETIRAINLKPDVPPKPGEKTLAERLENGRLTLSLKNAEGLYRDFYSFKGDGTAVITGAELGQLNLLGLLSELLSKTIFNFSSFSLNKLDAQFVLDGPRLHFGSLKLSGPTASIDAKGDYGLQDHRLDFKAKVFPLDESKSLVLSPVKLVLTPFSNVLEVKLQGTMAKPDWVFVYGPTNLLRSLIGAPSFTPALPLAPEPTSNGP